MKTSCFPKLVLASCLVVATGQALIAGESWPPLPPEKIAEERSYKQHEEDLLARIQPEIDAWAKKGKPYIPSAEKPEDLPQAKVPAFPGAEGGGEYSFGGRGGKVFVVTSLEDSGPGTLREACEAAGPRIVVFNIAGIIHLKMPIFIEAPYITIAGQTAPGDGICIADQGIVDNAHDVVIRYLHLRRGIQDIYNRHGTHYGDPIGNIILDHLSASWGNDQNLDTYRHLYTPPGAKQFMKLPSVNVTIQWCITAEALNTWNHAFGGDWGGRNTGFHHNLIACNTGRNPSVAMSYDFNFVNNVIFNWKHRSVDGGDKDSTFNIINNYYKPGPATNEGGLQFRLLEPAQTWSKADPVSKWGKAYVSGNVVEGNAKVTADNWDGGVQFNAAPDPNAAGGIVKGQIKDDDKVNEIIKNVRVDTPFPMPNMTVTSAQVAYDAVLANAGDSLHPDSVDKRVIEETRTGKVIMPGEWTKITTTIKKLPKNDYGSYGDGIITDIAQVGGYPDYKGTPRTDVGADGIPSSWKAKYHLDANDPDLASKDLMGDGYTVIEKYLNGLNPNLKIDWSDSKANTNTLTRSTFD